MGAYENNHSNGEDDISRIDIQLENKRWKDTNDAILNKYVLVCFSCVGSRYSVFSRLLIEESIPSNEFLSDRKMEVESQMAWDSKIQQFGSVTQLSLFPVEHCSYL